jgi:hypothetical protein
MANTLSFTVDSIASDRLTGILLDGTTYGSPARSATALYAKGQKMNADSTVDSTLTLTGDAANPETDTQFTFTIPKDGWFRFLIASIPDYDVGVTYSIYDAVFTSGTATVYRSKAGSNTGQTLTDTAWWEEITDPTTLASNEGEATESANIDSTIYEPLITANSEYAFANRISLASEEYLASQNIPDDDLDTYGLLAIFVDGGIIRGDRSEMSQGERIIRRMDSVIEALG